jgi:pimeloyl-ACP methyl ester carboxylesterase
MLKFFPTRDHEVSCWINPRDFGSHEKSLVFIHGSGGNSSAWSHQYTKLHKSFNIAAVNLPGHGKSGGSGRQDIHDYVHPFQDLLHSLGLTKPILIGHSLGAAIALSFAARHPADISAVISVGGGLTMPVNPAILDGLSQQPEEIRDLIAKFSLAKENRPAMLAPLRASLDEVNTQVLLNDLKACNQMNLADEISKIRVPALIICGTEDKMTPVEASRRIADGITGSKLLLIENAGHMVMMEKPSALNKAIRDFAASLPQVIHA